MVLKIYKSIDGNLSYIDNKTIAFIGYGNKAKAQALNMKDSGILPIIGNLNEDYKQRAEFDGFKTYSISEAVSKADFIFLLCSPHKMKEIYRKYIKSNLDEKKTIIFSDGYYVTFDIIEFPKNLDILLISPRLPGKGVRERFLNDKGFFTFVGIHQDYSGHSKQNLLALTKALGGLIQPAIELSFKEQCCLSLFIKHAFFPAFNQVLMKSIDNLVKNGYPPEAVFVELILSGEMSYTVEKMIDVGLINQMNFHSQTSQYGSLSRSIKFRKFNKEIFSIQNEILNQIEKGSFAKEWESKQSDLILKFLKYYASHTKFSKIEKSVRKKLKFKVKNHNINNSELQVEDLKDLGKKVKLYKDYYSQF
jgi:ketol-acid reductoisomerase